MKALERARVLTRLSRLCERGVPLPEGLAALASDGLGKDLALGAQAAREGNALDVVLQRAGLLQARDRSLLAAGRERPVQALSLLASEARCDAELRQASGELLARPLARGLVALLLIGAIAAVLVTVNALTLGGGGYTTFDIGLIALAVWLGWTLFCVGAYKAFSHHSRFGRRLGEAVVRRASLFGPLLSYEIRARFFGVLSTGLAGGLPLAPALGRVREAFGDRGIAHEIGQLEAQAARGAPLSTIVRAAPFLDHSSAWLTEAAAARPDFSAELAAMAEAERARLLHESKRWGPLFSAVVEFACLLLAVTISVVGTTTVLGGLGI